MEKAEILEAIRRCAEANGGEALGRDRFEDATGTVAAVPLADPFGQP